MTTVRGFVETSPSSRISTDPHQPPFFSSSPTTTQKAYTAYKVYQAVGKKGAELRETDLQTVAESVGASCPQSADQVAAVLAAKLEELDADGDGSLTGEELDNFNTFLGKLFSP
ncbi:hypothetical protein ACOMHN_036517 [Nucella lapillus]